jgi:hypothetical protein
MYVKFSFFHVAAAQIVCGRVPVCSDADVLLPPDSRLNLFVMTIFLRSSYQNWLLVF